MTSNMKPKPSEKPGATASVAELAELFAVNRRTISSLASKGILARTGHGRYERVASIRSYVIHLREVAAGRLSNDPNALDVVTESANLKREQAMLAKARRRILENEVIDVSRIQPLWARHARVVRTSVMSIASRVRAALPHLSAFDQCKIDEIARDSLTDLPQKAPAIEAGLGEAFRDDEEDETQPGGINGKPRLAKRLAKSK